MERGVGESALQERSAVESRPERGNAKEAEEVAEILRRAFLDQRYEVDFMAGPLD